MASYKQVARVGPRCLQLAIVCKKVYFGVETIAPSPSKPAAIFKMNEGDNKNYIARCNQFQDPRVYALERHLYTAFPLR